jgi:hypothetical protein
MGVEPSGFIPDGGGGETLPRRVKSRFPTFCEIIKYDRKKKTGKMNFLYQPPNWYLFLE